MSGGAELQVNVRSRLMGGGYAVVLVGGERVGVVRKRLWGGWWALHENGGRLRCPGRQEAIGALVAIGVGRHE